MRNFTKTALATLAALVLAGCASLTSKKAEKADAKKILDEPVESFVVKKGDTGYSDLYETFKADIEAKVADKTKREETVFELDGKNAHAYLETTGVERFQAGDTDIATKPYGIEKLLAMGREDLREHIKKYDEVVKKMYDDKKISVQERDMLGKYVKTTLRNLENKKNRDPVSQLLFRHLLKELNAQIEFYAGNGTKEYYLAVGLVDGTDLGLTGNPQKVDLPEAGIAAVLSAGGSNSYARARERAKKHALHEYTPVPPKSKYGGDRAEELKKARESWTDIKLTEAQALANTDKVGLANVGTRLSKDRMTGFTDGKFENREIAPGATYVQIVVTGADTTEDVAKAAQYGGKVVGE